MVARVRRLRPGAQISARLHALRLTSIPTPRRAAPLISRQSGPPDELRQVQSVHDQGQSPAGLDDPDVRDAGRALGRRAGDDVRRCWPRRCWSRPTSRRSRSASIRRRASTTATRSRRRRQAFVRHADEQGRRRRRSAHAAGRRARRGRARRAHDPLRPQGAHRRHDLQGRQPAGVLAQVGRGPDGKPKQFDEIVTEYPIATGPVHDRQRRSAAAASSSSATRTTGRATCGVRRGQFNFDRIVYRYYQDRRGQHGGVQGRRIRPHPGVFGARAGCASTQGAKWRDGRIVKKVFENGFGRACRRTCSTCAGRMFQDRARARGARLHVRFRDRSTSTACTSARTACSPTPISPRAACRGPGELELLEPFRKQLPPEVFGPPYQPPRTDDRPERAAREPEEGARAAGSTPAGRSTPDGVLRNAQGEPFEFEYLETQARLAVRARRSGSATSRSSASS